MINGGFFVLSPKVIDLIQGTNACGSANRLKNWLTMAQLAAYEHEGFWQPMDTLRDKMYLEDLWQTGNAPWKVW